MDTSDSNRPKRLASEEFKGFGVKSKKQKSDALAPIEVKGYHVFIGKGSRFSIPSGLKNASNYSRYLIITDGNVGKLYSADIVRSFEDSRHKTLLYTIPPGEQSKCRQMKSDIEDWMLKNRCGRDTMIVALGGGVVGDLAGFVAATYMRGISFIQVPTTILAMVDSSIGGKTGIDTDAGKNLVGAFHRPKGVYIDLEFLKTLPKREFSNGMAEIIKAGAIRDASLFHDIEVNSEQIQNIDLDVIAPIIHRGVKIKADVVRQDELEGGLRLILNFGHSIGHGIEAIMSPDLLHGECVSIGMVLEAKLARRLGFLNSNTIWRLKNCLEAFNLPTELPEKLRIDSILEHMGVDKKNKGLSNNKMIVMLNALGSVNSKPAYTTSVSDKQLAQILSPLVSIVPGIASGTVSVPGSKFVSDMVLLIAAMGQGTCRISGLVASDDTIDILRCLAEMGVNHEWHSNGEVLVMQGSGGQLQKPQRPLYISHSANVARLMIPLCTIFDGSTIISCSDSVRKLPTGNLCHMLQQMNHEVDYEGERKTLPMKITPSESPRTNIVAESDLCWEDLAALLLSAPYARSTMKIYLQETFAGTSQAGVELTMRLMKQFGINVTNERGDSFVVERGEYKNPEEYRIPGDPLLAAYPLALSAIAGGQASINNLGEQTDSQLMNLFGPLGEISRSEQSGAVTLIPNKELNTVDEFNVMESPGLFPVAAILAAASNGSTRFVNIPPKLKVVKKMVKLLKSCGVTVHESAKTIEVEGKTSEISGTLINCDGDATIAMSFAALGAKVPGIVISGNDSVDTIYPDFWDSLRRDMNVKLDVPIEAETVLQTTHRGIPPNKSIFIIGMRAAGKTTLGRHAARSLGRKFADIDELIEKGLGCSIKDFVRSKDWKSFRNLEHETLEKAVKEKGEGWVISCGGGIVETKACRDILQELPFVVQLNRHIDDIEDFLCKDPTRPKYVGEQPSTVWERRKPLFKESGQYEFLIRKNDHDWERIRHDFVWFLRRLIKFENVHPADLGATINLGTDEQSYFLSLTCKNIDEYKDKLTQMSRGVDAFELRVDLLSDHSEDYVKDQVAALRRQTKMPLIFTVRSNKEGGNFRGTEKQMFDLLKLGVRLGCEFVDMEVDWSPEAVQDFLSCLGCSKVIASRHVPHGNGGTAGQLSQLFRSCSLGGKADVVKVVISASFESDAIRLISVASSINLPKHQGSISLAMGSRGKISRVMNQTLTPVTHELLPSAAAPGQMTVRDIENCRQTLGMTDKKFYVIFGKPVGLSPSPNLHNTGFRYLYLPHHYRLHETDEVEEVKKVISESDFGGASVTIPMKEKVGQLLNSLSHSAKTIGAVNTIIKHQNGTLTGDNTDWIGIYRPLQRLLQKRRQERKDDMEDDEMFLIVGAGGTSRAACYAAQQLGFGKDIYIYNRTLARAQRLAEQFDCQVCEDISKFNKSVSVLLSTLPGTANFKAPDNIIRQTPIVFDVCYIPKETSLLIQAKKQKCDFVQGIDMIIEQGVAQFELWTRRNSPKDVIDASVRKAYAELKVN